MSYEGIEKSSKVDTKPGMSLKQIESMALDILFYKSECFHHFRTSTLFIIEKS